MSGRSLCQGLIFGLLLLCAACATPYQARDLDGFGYSFRQVEAGEYLVSFTGNTATSVEQAQDFALLRAAQIAVTLGYEGILVLDTSNEEVFLPAASVHAAEKPQLVGTPGLVTVSRDQGNNRGDTVTLHVRFLKHRSDAAGKPTEDAHAIVKRLSAKYSLQLATAAPHR